MLLPDSAPEARIIEVVRVTGEAGYPYTEPVAGEVVDLWDGPALGEVLGLIAALPGGESYRCFAPGWAVRMHGVADLLFEIAFCFRCNGAMLNGPTVPARLRGIQTFDAESGPAVDLLRMFRSCAPDASSLRRTE